jgi:tetratricopeptide (TPR) repeat protein
MMIGHAYTGAKGLGDYPRALTNLNEALEIARAADLQWHIGPTLLGLDHVRACTGDYGVAWTGMLKTLRWLESLKQVRYQLIAYDFIGHLLLDLDLNEQALQHMERGLALSRESGIDFWRVGIEAHCAIAGSRLGRKDVEPSLQDALERARRSCERYLATRCLEGLAAVSLRRGDASRCRAFADELLALAQANGLCELEASALRWRGEAWLAEKAYEPAQAELSRAAALAEPIGRARLGMDVHAGLARLFAEQGERDAAQRPGAKARAIAEALEKSLVSSGLEARLRPAGDGT